MASISSAVCFLLLACLAPFVLKVTTRMGIFVPRLNHSPGPCRVVPGIDCGAEDIAVTSDGLAFISSGFRGLTTCEMSDIKGNIFLFNFSNPWVNVTRLLVDSSEIDMETFEPHGLGIFEEKANGSIFLFAVDHSEQHDTIRIFMYDRSFPNSLLHIESIRDPYLRCLNDVVPTGPRSFYATTYLRLCSILKHSVSLELVLSLFFGMTYVSYFDGSKAIIAASGLKMANGIDLSRDGSFVYVVTSEPGLSVFMRSRVTNELELLHRIPIQANGDNVFVDSSGDLYIGALSHMGMYFIADYEGPNAVPSQVVRVRAKSANLSNYEITEVLHSSGQGFVRFGSSAASYGRHLLVGSICHKLGYCFMETMY